MGAFGETHTSLPAPNWLALCLPRCGIACFFDFETSDYSSRSCCKHSFGWPTPAVKNCVRMSRAGVMPDAAPSAMEDSESRSTSVGRHALAGATATKLASSASASSLHSSTSSPRSTSSKKRKRGRRKPPNVRDFVPMGAKFSKSSELLRSPNLNLADKAEPSVPASNPDTDIHVQPSAMVSSSPNLGQNRLAKGFRSSQASAPISALNKSRTLSISSHDTSGGGSKDDAIEISSDEEMEDSEGGMIVNVHDNVPALTNGSVSEDEGLVTTSDDDDVLQIHEDLTRAAEVADSASAKSSDLRLLDLSPNDLEEQIKYGVYHLDRTQVDLNRLVTCLSCMQLGHLASDCIEGTCTHCQERSHPGSPCANNNRCRKCRERGHSSQECVADLKVTTVPCDVCGRLSHVEQDCPNRHFPQPRLQAPVKLWISCCICASKSHLVGDCPNAPVNASIARWSIKSLDSNQITNMSLESGTRKLEKDAETRGMRPAGMQIRGRAGLHRADTSKATAVSGDETDFLRPSRGHNDQPPKPQVRLGNYEPRRPSPPRGVTTNRYDRFDAPSYDYRSQNRGRGDWYGTDSFGRRRSRSPVQDSYRPGSRRSPSPRRFDGYPQSDRGYRAAPPPSDYWRPQNGLPPRPSGSNSLATPATADSSRPIQLPTRKGSNPSLPLKSTFKPLTKPVPADQQSRKNEHSQDGAIGNKKKKKKKKGRTGQA